MSEHATPNDGHEHHAWAHALSIPALLGTYIVLVILTLITVWLINFDFGYTFNLVLALGVAFVKSVLVAWYFMHLKADARLNSMIHIGALLFVTLFIAFSLIDTSESLPNHNAPSIPGVIQ